jgi:hypothetical protein
MLIIGLIIAFDKMFEKRGASIVASERVKWKYFFFFKMQEVAVLLHCGMLEGTCV